MKRIYYYFFILLGLSQLISSCTSSTNQQSVFNVKEFGATGNKEEICTKALQQAIDACYEAGGGMVYLPPGAYTSGTIILKSNVNLHIEAGAVLYASLDTNDYPNDFFVYKKNDSGKKGDGATPVLIYAKNCENISITGNGIINGEAIRVYEPLKEVDGFIKDETKNAKESGIEMKMYYKVPPFTCMVFIESSSNIKISSVSFIEATDWTLHFKWCQDILISDCIVKSSLEKGVNADGIDIDGCKNVTITNSIVETGDDAIVLKSTSTFDKFESCENVTVSNCVLVSTSTALKLGTESYGDFKYINFNNCVIRNSNRGLSIVVRDGATVSNVTFSNITIECNRKHFNWWGNGDPIWLVVKKRFPHSKVGKIENVSFQNVIAHGQGTSQLDGFPGSPLRNISFDHCKFYLEAEDKADKRADHILEATLVENLFLNNLQCHWDTTKGLESKWASALHLNKVNGFRIDRLNASQAPGKELAAIQIDSTSNGILFGCMADFNTHTFINLEASQNIILRENFLMHAKNELLQTNSKRIIYSKN